MNGFFRSFLFAFRGIGAMLKSERNFKVQFSIFILTIITGFYFSIEQIEWIIICICSGLVLSLEMINSAIEQLCNELTTDTKPSIGRLKDIAAGAVLVSSIFSLIVGCLIFAKYLL